MSGELNKIREFFSRDGVFVCKPCVKDEGYFEAQISHSLGRPASNEQIARLERTMGKSLTPSHRQVLSIWNGFTLFSQANTRTHNPGFFSRLFGWKGGESEEVGIRFYSTDELPTKHAEVIQQNEEALKELLDDPDEDVVTGVTDDLKNWLPNLLIIGEECMSGNYLALDYRQGGEIGESPIVYLDHELMYQGSDDRDIIATSVTELLVKLKENPAEFLNDTLSCITRYSDGKTDEQWIPSKYRID